MKTTIDNLTPRERELFDAYLAGFDATALRKRILRPPVLIRADLFVGDTADTEATYVGNEG